MTRGIRKKQPSTSKAIWRKKARVILAEAFNSKCGICDYNKTIGVLNYNHLDPNKKSLQISTAMREGYSWSKIVSEARKCVLICCRCHREIHLGITEMPKNCVRFNEKYKNAMQVKTIEYNKCYCSKRKNKLRKYCSCKCRDNANIKFVVTKSILQKLINSKTYVAIGKEFDVTDTCIRKRCKKLGIHRQKRAGITQR